MVLAETVYEAEKCVEGRTHRREDTGSTWGVKSKGKSQKPKGKTIERSGSRMMEKRAGSQANARVGGGGEFSLWIQACGAENPPNLLNDQALGRLPESPHPRPGDYPSNCLRSCPDRCLVRCPEGYLDRYPPMSFPRSFPGCSAGYSRGCRPLYSVRCSIRCSPGWSDRCGPSSSTGCRPRCCRGALRIARRIASRAALPKSEVREQKAEVREEGSRSRGIQGSSGEAFLI
jgi:hypothetical protein